MSYYHPDPAAVPVGTPFTRQLVSVRWLGKCSNCEADLWQSQRDLGAQIPVNYVTVPGVVVTQYEVQSLHIESGFVANHSRLHQSLLFSQAI